MLLNLKRLLTPYPHRPWRMPRRLLLLLLVAFGFWAWLFGHAWERQRTTWHEAGSDGGIARP